MEQKPDIDVSGTLPGLLDERGLAPIDLAYLLNKAGEPTTTLTIERWLKGSSNPSWEKACKTADALGVSISALRPTPSKSTT